MNDSTNPIVSPDGTMRWDGTAWQPNSSTTVPFQASASRWSRPVRPWRAGVAAAATAVLALGSYQAWRHVGDASASKSSAAVAISVPETLSAVMTRCNRQANADAPPEPEKPVSITTTYDWDQSMKNWSWGLDIAKATNDCVSADGRFTCALEMYDSGCQEANAPETKVTWHALGL
ncbi:hypothetical protein GCM10025868_46620 [Angustibacter aerolatus]|uniref:DUF2510 domain-containing protein n=1 Tax=Angustibacter aerolatus TaxID=1162965 RepID=A0ABQ6JMA6_9ACTN|nr:hypothetical protein GCM10025868_46620 [Angustibacter aerolatus]